MSGGPGPTTTTTTTTTITTTASSTSTATATAAGTVSPPMVSAPAEIAQKRKRGSSNSSPSPAMKGSDDERPDPVLEKRKQVLDQIAKDLLVVLKEHDTQPSILTATIPTNDTPSPEGGPPNKRAKLSSRPPTIAERLASGTYTAPAALLSDIGAVCRALDAPQRPAQHFAEFARDVITRECLRRPALLLDALPLPLPGPGPDPREKVALMVMAHHGPLFSSLQNPTEVEVVVAAEGLSRSASAASESSPAASTAPTSTCASPNTGPTRVMRVIAPLNEASLPPLISTVKAASNPLKREAPEGEKVPTLGEAFPPVRISSLAPPKAGSVAAAGVGLKWGGAVGPGGAAAANPAAARPDPAGEWLLYRNHLPRTAKYRAMVRGEPIRQGMGLPPDFVAAYTSFAPTRDDAGAKVPAGVRNRVWWERLGRAVFRQTFADHPGVGHMYREYEVAKKPDGDVEMIEAAARDEQEQDEEEVFRKAVESWEPDEDVPIDFRLLEGAEDKKEQGDEDEDEPAAGTNPDETLKEISNLLKRLQSHQYIRLSTAPAPPAPRITTSTNGPSTSTPTAATTAPDTPHTPTPEELTLYNDIQTRLTHLISTLPPHLTITTDGTPSAPLTISPLIPLTHGTPVYTGTLPSTPAVQPAAIAALNAAVGMSPSAASSSSPAPIAMMARAAVNVPAPPLPPRLAGAPNVQTYYQPQQYHGHQLPAATQPHHYPSPYAPPPPRVVSPGVQRVGQPMFHAHSMPPTAAPRRVNVPPPMGLAAIGAGYGGGYGPGGAAAGGAGGGQRSADGLRMGVQHTQASMENGTVPGGRYAGRSRR